MNHEFVQFITRRTHLDANEVKSEVRLAEDIGFYGLDAHAFFEEFFETFKIERLHEFDADLYINGSVDFPTSPIDWLKNILIKDRRKYLRPDVTMGHLNKVFELGEWIDEK